jgi:intracellular sulfur oxidation DsrE/DsrF family protein
MFAGEEVMSEATDGLARRSIMSGMGVGLLAAGVVGATQAQAQTARNQIAQHPEDNWLDRPNAAHRLVIDSTSPEGGGGALAFANNFFEANKAGYKLEAPSIAVVVVLRHFSTPFAYKDTMWGKYGAVFTTPTHFTDPKTKQAPKINVYNADGYGLSLPNFGVTIDAAAKQGVQFAVCDMATHFFAMQIADSMKLKPDAVYRELTGNLIPNAHLVAAGIVAVNRAQERGYTFAYSA